MKSASVGHGNANPGDERGKIAWCAGARPTPTLSTLLLGATILASAIRAHQPDGSLHFAWPHILWTVSIICLLLTRPWSE